MSQHANARGHRTGVKQDFDTPFGRASSCNFSRRQGGREFSPDDDVVPAKAVRRYPGFASLSATISPGLERRAGNGVFRIGAPTPILGARHHFSCFQILGMEEMEFAHLGSWALGFAFHAWLRMIAYLAVKNSDKCAQALIPARFAMRGHSGPWEALLHEAGRFTAIKDLMIRGLVSR